MTNQSTTGLALLREPVPARLVSKMAKGTKQQEKCPDEDKVRCEECFGRHALGMSHFDYVGHAATTALLLDADPHWNWEPVAFDDEGLPCFDASGGLWIRLAVCGQTRLGYGNAPRRASAAPGDREKEVIGDAIRNAAMRFGLALDLWSKVDLHDTGDAGDTGDEPRDTQTVEQWRNGWITRIKAGKKVGEVRAARAAAIADAERRGDTEAPGYFLVAAAERLQLAKPVKQAPLEPPPNPPDAGRASHTHDDPFELDESDIPH